MSGSGSGMVKPTSAMRQGAPSRLYAGREGVKQVHLSQYSIHISQGLNSLSDHHTTLTKCLPRVIIKCCYFSCGSVRHVLLL